MEQARPHRRGFLGREGRPLRASEPGGPKPADGLGRSRQRRTEGGKGCEGESRRRRHVTGMASMGAGTGDGENRDSHPQTTCAVLEVPLLALPGPRTVLVFVDLATESCGVKTGRAPNSSAEGSSPLQSSTGGAAETEPRTAESPPEARPRGPADGVLPEAFPANRSSSFRSLLRIHSPCQIPEPPWGPWERGPLENPGLPAGPGGRGHGGLRTAGQVGCQHSPSALPAPPSMLSTSSVSSSGPGGQ